MSAFDWTRASSLLPRPTVRRITACTDDTAFSHALFSSDEEGEDEEEEESVEDEESEGCEEPCDRLTSLGEDHASSSADVRSPAPENVPLIRSSLIVNRAVFKEDKEGEEVEGEEVEGEEVEGEEVEGEEVEGEEVEVEEVDG